MTAIYTYDSFGRRIHKDIRDNNEVLLSSTSYFYDGDQVISEYNESDTLLRKYIYGPGIDEPILIENTIGDRYYYHFDGLGSVRELTDSAGTIVEKYEYDVYGKTTIRNAQNEIINTSQIDNPYAYTGRRLDPETGLYYYRARHYNPETGRFLQTDPIGYYDSMNLYGYCLNNPVNWIDPYGLEAGLGGGLGFTDPLPFQNSQKECPKGKTEYDYFWENIYELLEAIKRAAEYERWFEHQKRAEAKERTHDNAHEKEAWDWGRYVGDPNVAGAGRTIGEAGQFIGYSLKNAWGYYTGSQQSKYSPWSKEYMKDSIEDIKRTMEGARSDKNEENPYPLIPK